MTNRRSWSWLIPVAAALALAGCATLADTGPLGPAPKAASMLAPTTGAQGPRVSTAAAATRTAGPARDTSPVLYRMVVMGAGY